MFTGFFSTGDITLRVKQAVPIGGANVHWFYYTTATLGVAKAVSAPGPNVIAAHDVTDILAKSSGVFDPVSVSNATPDRLPFPLRVIRSYERSPDGAGTFFISVDALNPECISSVVVLLLHSLTATLGSENVSFPVELRFMCIINGNKVIAMRVMPQHVCSTVP